MSKILLNFSVILIVCFGGSNIQSSRIMNGTKALCGQFPFIVSLQSPDERKNQCGGTLISANHVLTANHCLLSGINSRIVVAGILNCVDFDKGYQTSRIKSIFTPGPFSNEKWTNDIAILLTVEKFIKTRFIQFLPYQLCQVSIGDEVLIAGWGTSNEGKPKILQWANAEINEYEICGSDNPKMNKDALLCVRGNIKISTSRQSDSGSPGLYEGKIFGVVSMGIPSPEYGAYYSKLSFYHNWIVRTLNTCSIGQRFLANIVHFYLLMLFL